MNSHIIILWINNIWPPTSDFCGRKTFSFQIISRERIVFISLLMLLLCSVTVFDICTDKPRILNIGLRDYVQWVLQPFSFSHSYHTRICQAEVGWRQVQFPSLLRGVIKSNWCWEKEIQCDEHSKTWLASLWDRIGTTSRAELLKHQQKIQGKYTYKLRGGSRKEIESRTQTLKHIKLNSVFQYQRAF